MLGGTGPPFTPPPEPSQSGKSSGWVRALEAFRGWRRGRPFWGGLCCILGGLVIAAGPTTAVRVILIAGTAVWLGILIGVLVAVMGIFIWVQPQLRHLCGILAALLSVLSLLTSDYGGFILGMSLGIVGGGLAFAWTAVQPASEPEVDRQSQLPF